MIQSRTQFFVPVLRVLLHSEEFGKTACASCHSEVVRAQQNTQKWYKTGSRLGLTIAPLLNFTHKPHVSTMGKLPSTTACPRDPDGLLNPWIPPSNSLNDNFSVVEQAIHLSGMSCRRLYCWCLMVRIEKTPTMAEIADGPFDMKSAPCSDPPTTTPQHTRVCHCVWFARMDMRSQHLALLLSHIHFLLSFFCRIATLQPETRVRESEQQRC